MSYFVRVGSNRFAKHKVLLDRQDHISGGVAYASQLVLCWKTARRRGFAVSAGGNSICSSAAYVFTGSFRASVVYATILSAIKRLFTTF